MRMTLSPSDEQCVKFAQKLSSYDENYFLSTLWSDLKDTSNTTCFLVCLVAKLLCCDPNYVECIGATQPILSTLKDLVGHVLVRSNLRISSRQSVRPMESTVLDKAEEDTANIMQTLLFVATFYNFDHRNDSLRSMFLEWSASRGALSLPNSAKEKEIMKILQLGRDAFMAATVEACLSLSSSSAYKLCFANVAHFVGAGGAAETVLSLLLTHFEKELAQQLDSPQLVFAWLFTVKVAVLHSVYIPPQFLADLSIKVRTCISSPAPVGPLALEIFEFLLSELNAPGTQLRTHYSTTYNVFVLLERGHAPLPANRGSLADVLQSFLCGGANGLAFWDAEPVSSLSTEVARSLLLRAFKAYYGPEFDTTAFNALLASCPAVSLPGLLDQLCVASQQAVGLSELDAQQLMFRELLSVASTVARLASVPSKANSAPDTDGSAMSSSIFLPVPQFVCRMLPATRSGVVEKSELTEILSDIIRVRPVAKPTSSSADTDAGDIRVPVKIVVVGSDAAIADVATAWLWLCSHNTQQLGAVDVSFYHLCLNKDVALEESKPPSRNVTSHSFHDPPEEFEQSTIIEEEEEEEDVELTIGAESAEAFDPGTAASASGSNGIFNGGEAGLDPGETKEVDGRLETSLTMTERMERSLTMSSFISPTPSRTRRYTVGDTSGADSGQRRVSGIDWTPFQEEFESPDAFESFWVSKPLEFVSPPPAVDPVAGHYIFQWLCKEDWFLRRQAQALRAILGSANIITSLFAKPAAVAVPPGPLDVQCDAAPQYLAAQMLFGLCCQARARCPIVVYQVELRFARSPQDDPAKETPGITIILLRGLRFIKGAGSSPQVRIDLWVADTRGQVTSFRGQAQAYDDISLLRIPLPQSTVPYPSPVAAELELSYTRKNRTTAMLLHSCMLTTLDEVGVTLNIDGRLFERVSIVRIVPATALSSCPAGFREQYVTLPLMRFTDFA